jgi:phenylalanyl-tRNA synthetase beta chain
MVDTRGISPGEIAHRLTMSTAEIESIDYLNSHFSTIYSAKILDIIQHPNADKLTLVDLDTGKEKHRVVCGASNHKKGDIVALATVGTRFSEEFEIKKTKIRGEASSGMLCSEKELGISEDHSGIMILPADTEIGIPLSELFPHRVDARLEIDNKSITHRPDLWSHHGFAREVGALFNRKVKKPVNPAVKEKLGKGKSIKVRIDTPEGCPRYSGLVVKNIKIGESPGWLKAMVTSIGMRPINNIVDITNYVMAEIGEPMHAFDMQKLNGDTIIVRMAGNGEWLETLDGGKHELCDQDVVIADSKGAVALAGVMGGGNSEIEEGTDTIVLEAANFNPVSIRRTSVRYGLRTEASMRFEKALSPALTEAALLRCYELIREIIPEAEAVTPIVDAYPVAQEDIEIYTSTDFIRRKLGIEISDREITNILTSLGYELGITGQELAISVPAYRATKDVSIPADIVEEVGRIYGFDNIKSTAPLVPCTTPEKNPHRDFERNVKEILCADCGMSEIFGYSFTCEDILNRLEINTGLELVLKNPLTRDHDRLRRSIIPNIIQNIQLNQKFQDEFSTFELGRTYLKKKKGSTDLPEERSMAAGAVFKKTSEYPVFYDAKNIIQILADRLMLEEITLVPASSGLPSYCHPGRSMKIEIGGKEAGMIFELHPKTKEDFDIHGSAAVFEIDLDACFECKKKPVKFSELQKFPEVPFEISVLADRFAYSSDICDLVKESYKKNVKSVDVITIYEGDPIPVEKKSVSLKVVLYSREKTLSPEEIETMQKKIIKNLDRAGYTLR